MEIKEVKDKIYLRVKIADGSVGEDKFVISMLVNGGGLLVEFADTKYLISTEEAIKEIAKIRGKK